MYSLFVMLVVCSLLAVIAARRMDSFEDATIPLYVINLKRRPDRLDACVKRLPGESPIVVEAVDGYRLQSNDTGLTKGELGCFMSHLKAMRLILESHHSYALVLEDDAVLVPGYLDTLHTLIKSAPPDFGVISLGCNSVPSKDHMLEVAPGLCVFRDFDLYGAHALLYSRTGAERFLGHALLTGPCEPFDLWLTRCKAAPVLVAIPPLATAHNIKDTDTQKTR